MNFGTFTLIKNEIQWIGPHLCAWLPYVDEMVFYDGNSTDGTISTIELVRDQHELGKKIKLFKNKDINDFDEDYTKMSNLCLHELSTDFAMFLHPDMFPSKGMENLKNLNAIAYTTHKVSYAGDNMFELLKFKNGRNELWKDIMRLNNPDLGLHYFGAYGAANEDTYFSAITGNEHLFYGTSFNLYPYPIDDSGLWIDHFSDVRPYKRRFERMYKSLLNQGRGTVEALSEAENHPRVSLKSDSIFQLEPVEIPKSYMHALDVYEKLGGLCSVS